ncbi:MAG: hypothetical protein RJA81_536, partial [Planctomycetota bacterium]
ALRESVQEDLRIKALEELAHWGDAKPRDAVIGVWRPLAARNPEEAQAQLSAFVNKLLVDKSEPFLKAASAAAGALKVNEAGTALKVVAINSKLTGGTRAEALKALKAINAPDLATVVEMAVADKDPAFRSEGRNLLASLEPARAVELIREVLEKASNREKQVAFATLAEMKDARADALLAVWMKRMTEDRVPAAVRLDILTAAQLRANSDDNTELKNALASYLSSKSSDDPLSAYIECLEGGQGSEGKNVVWNNTAAACLRCHIVTDKGGNVGPELNGIGKRYDRRTILESIVNPNAKIAEGFQSVVLGLKDGTVVAGVLRKETPEEIVIVTAEAKTIAIPTSEVEERAKGISAMPNDIASKLTKQEIRDVVEYLFRLK